MASYLVGEILINAVSWSSLHVFVCCGLLLEIELCFGRKLVRLHITEHCD